MSRHRRPKTGTHVAAKAAGVAAALGTLAAPQGVLAPGASAAPVGGTGVSASSHQVWPAMTPQGGRWKRDGSPSIHDYYDKIGSYNQGSAEDRRRGSTRHYAIRAWQRLLNEHRISVGVDGVYGPATARAVARFQRQYNTRVPRAYRLRVNGRVNYPTARALLAPTIRREARRFGMSADLLCGHLNAESVLDGRAIGPGGTDYGFAQLSRRYHQHQYTLAQAFNEDVAIAYMARRDAAARKTYGSYRIGVVSYWSPLEAKRWKESGRPSAKAKAYSDRAFAGCDGYEFS